MAQVKQGSKRFRLGWGDVYSAVRHAVTTAGACVGAVALGAGEVVGRAVGETLQSGTSITDIATLVAAGKVAAISFAGRLVWRFFTDMGASQRKVADAVKDAAKAAAAGEQ